MNYPLPYWWNIDIPTLDSNDYYFNSYTQEQRLKKIAEDICLLRKLYNILVDAINDHETRIVELERIVADHERRIKELERIAADHEKRIKALERQIADHENRIQELETQIADHETRIQTLEGKVATIEGQITDLYQKYEKLKKDLEDLTERVSTNESDIDSINQHIANIDQQIVTLGQRIDEIINTLPNKIVDIIKTNPEVQQAITDIVNRLMANKMDKVPTATEDHIATFDNAGQVKDSTKTLEDIKNDIINEQMSGTAGNFPVYDDDGHGIKDSTTKPSDYYKKNNTSDLSKRTLVFLGNDGELHSNNSYELNANGFSTNDPLTDLDEIMSPLDVLMLTTISKGTSVYHDFNKPFKKIHGITVKFTCEVGQEFEININDQTYKTNFIYLMTDNNYKRSTGYAEQGPVELFSIFKDSSNRKYIAYAFYNRFDTLVNKTFQDIQWELISHQFIESDTEENAKALSLAMPNTIVYIPEEEE